MSEKTQSTDPTHDDTIDWNEYWRDADEDAIESATPSTHHVRDLLADLFEEKGVPDSFADVGCGPGVVSFDVAEKHPETDVVGYDAAESILAENRERADREGFENVSFEQAVLPDFDPGRRFDLVLVYGTMVYVEESERALQRLYDAVAPGGHLVMGYVNDRGGAHYRGMIEAAENDSEEVPSDFDPEATRERFRLAIEGESTLSYRTIRDAIGTWPRSFWEFTDRPEERWAWDHVPLVWIPK